MAARRLVGGHDDGRETAAALAAMGLTPETRPGDADVSVDEDNAHSVEVFAAMMTQWNVGMNGATGLRYEALPVALRIAGVPRADWPAVFGDLRIMEAAAMEVIRGK